MGGAIGTGRVEGAMAFGGGAAGGITVAFLCPHAEARKPPRRTTALRKDRDELAAARRINLDRPAPSTQASCLCGANLAA